MHKRVNIPSFPSCHLCVAVYVVWVRSRLALPPPSLGVSSLDLGRLLRASGPFFCDRFCQVVHRRCIRRRALLFSRLIILLPRDRAATPARGSRRSEERRVGKEG